MKIYFFENKNCNSEFHYGWDNMIVIADSNNEAYNVCKNYTMKGDEFYDFDSEDFNITCLGSTEIYSEPCFLTGKYTPYNPYWDD